MIQDFFVWLLGKELAAFALILGVLSFLAYGWCIFGKKIGFLNE
jgi:predicted outer membrane lipoprotein